MVTAFWQRCGLSYRTGGHPFPGEKWGELQRQFDACLAPLDYNELNRELEQPTDENLARWIRRRLDVPGIETIGVQSTMHEGVDLDRREHVHVWRRYIFQSAHRLPNVRLGTNAEGCMGTGSR